MATHGQEIALANNGDAAYDHEQPRHSRSSSLQMAKDLLAQLEKDFSAPSTATSRDEFDTTTAALELVRSLVSQLQSGNLAGRQAALELGKELITILGDGKNSEIDDSVAFTRPTMHHDNVDPYPVDLRVEAPVADVEALVSIPDKFAESTPPPASYFTFWQEDNGRKAGIVSKIIEKLHLGGDRSTTDSSEVHLSRDNSTKIISRHFRLPVLRESTTGAYAQALTSAPAYYKLESPKSNDSGGNYPVLKSFKTNFKLDAAVVKPAPTCTSDHGIFCTGHCHDGAPAA